MKTCATNSASRSAGVPTIPIVSCSLQRVGAGLQAWGPPRSACSGLVRGTKDPDASPSLYVEALAAPETINTIPEKTLHAFDERGALRGVMSVDGTHAEAMLARFAEVGVDIDSLAIQLQHEGAQSFVKSWEQLLQRIADKRGEIASVS